MISFRSCSPFQIFILFLYSSHIIPGSDGNSNVSQKGIMKPVLGWTQSNNCPPGYYVDGISLIFSTDTERFENVQVTSQKKTSTKKIPKSLPIIFNPVVGVNMSCFKFDGSEDVFTYSIMLNTRENSTKHEKFFIKEISRCNKAPEENSYGSDRQSGLVVGTQSKFAFHNLIEMDTYCNSNERLFRANSAENDPNYLKTTGKGVRREKPHFCPWGYFACGVKLRFDKSTYFAAGLKTECCFAFKTGLGWNHYRGATNGRVLSSYSEKLSPAGKLRLLNSSELCPTHYISEFDDPYYYQWQFCPVGTFVTGIQGQLVNRQFRLSCADISVPAPREEIYLDSVDSIISLGKLSVKSQWDSIAEISPPTECESGLAIGMQVLYDSKTKEIQGLRLFCSHSMENPNELKYVKVLFPLKEEDRNRPTKAKSAAIWGPAQMCKRGEAICGWKVKHITDKAYNAIGTEHIKVKCCLAPSVAEVCSPYDKYELVLECDAREAFADTTCQYTLTEGLTISDSISEKYSVSNNLREALTAEWSLADASTLRLTDENGGSISTSNSAGISETNSTNSGSTKGITDSTGNSSSNSNMVINGASWGTLNGKTKGFTINSARDLSGSRSWSETASELEGNSNSHSATTSVGSSQNYLNTLSSGGSILDSVADTVGSSSGVVAAQTENKGRSKSQGTSHGQSSSISTSDTDHWSRHSSESNTRDKTKSLGFNVGATLKQIFSFGLDVKSEKKKSNTRTTSQDVGGSSSRTQGNEASYSTNQQETADESNSVMNQRTSESHDSKTRTSTKEKNEMKSEATGGESNLQNSLTGSRDQRHERTRNSAKEGSVSQTVREGKDISEQANEQENTEENRATHNTDAKEASFSRQILTQREDSLSATLMRNNEFSATRGMTFSNSRGADRSLTRGENKGNQNEKTFTTGYDWTTTSDRTWRKETISHVSMTVPAGMRTRLYQVVGYCAHFQARTNNFKRKDDVVGDPVQNYFSSRVQKKLQDDNNTEQPLDSGNNEYQNSDAEKNHSEAIEPENNDPQDTETNRNDLVTSSQAVEIDQQSVDGENNEGQ